MRFGNVEFGGVACVRLGNVELFGSAVCGMSVVELLLTLRGVYVTCDNPLPCSIYIAHSSRPHCYLL